MSIQKYLSSLPLDGLRLVEPTPRRGEGWVPSLAQTWISGVLAHNKPSRQGGPAMGGGVSGWAPAKPANRAKPAKRAQRAKPISGIGYPHPDSRITIHE